MNMDELLETLDELLAAGKLSEAEGLLLNALSRAASLNDARASLSILIELSGVYRAEEHFAESMNVAEQALTLLHAMGLTGTAPHASALNNAAVSYREGGKALDALECYDALEQIYQENLRPDDIRFAALYNDMALTCQGLQQYGQALEYFQKTEQILKLFRENGLELAVTYTNMAMNAQLLGDGIRAHGYLQKGERLFLEHNPQDPQYGALLTLRGQILYNNGSYQEAANAYAQALSLIEICFGKNETWKIIAEECAKAYWQAGDTENAQNLRNKIKEL